MFAGRLIDDYLRKARIKPKDRYELDGLELIAAANCRVSCALA